MCTKIEFAQKKCAANRHVEIVYEFYVRALTHAYFDSTTKHLRMYAVFRLVMGRMLLFLIK